MFPFNSWHLREGAAFGKMPAKALGWKEAEGPAMAEATKQMAESQEGDLFQGGGMKGEEREEGEAGQ